MEKEQNKIAVANQRKELPDPDLFIEEYYWEKGIPYAGAIGGGLSYIFTPTSIGTSVRVKSAFTNNELDVTDYGEW